MAPVEVAKTEEEALPFPPEFFADFASFAAVAFAVAASFAAFWPVATAAAAVGLTVAAAAVVGITTAAVVAAVAVAAEVRMMVLEVVEGWSFYLFAVVGK